ncbi:hypothetical protein J3E68DRAFT_434213 [Trichoderma sp. SZMC 28012]
MDTNPDLSSIEEAVHRISDGNQDQLFFEQATFLLYNAFPKQVKGQYLHEHWGKGNPLVDHIVTLNQRYLNKSLSPQIFPSLHYISLVSNCACWCSEIIRFLYEKGNYNEAREILNGGFDAYENLKPASKSDEIDVIRAHMLNTSATLDDCRGYFGSQIRKLKEVLEIRKRVLPEDHEEISGVLNNLCLAYESSMQFPEALKYREMSLGICWKHPKSKSRDTKIKKRDLVFSRLLLATGEPENAKELFPRLLEYFESIQNWYFIGHLYIVWGNYHFVRRDFGNSQKCFLHALEQYEEVGKVINHPQAAACLYKIGRVALEEGRLDKVMINFMLCKVLKTAGRYAEEIGKLEKEI